MSLLLYVYRHRRYHREWHLHRDQASRHIQHIPHSHSLSPSHIRLVRELQFPMSPFLKDCQENWSHLEFAKYYRSTVVESEGCQLS